MKNEQKEIENNLERSAKKLNMSIWILVIIAFMMIATFLIVQLLYDNGIIASNRFYDNTQINGINVAGMEKIEVANMISAKLLNDKDEISIELTYKNKKWILKGNDFENNSNIFPIIQQAFEKGRSGSIIERINTVRDIKQNGYFSYISYRSILGGFDTKIDEIIAEINTNPIEPKISFNPNTKEGQMFKLNEGVNGILVNKEQLYYEIDKAFSVAKKIEVEIPIKEIEFEKSGNELIANTKLRANFSTSYASSAAGRKNNAKLALSQFNGMIIEPGQEVGFNKITGDKTPERGYQIAKIILDGVFVEGYGGGACQSSTTLYNALLLADLEILEVHPHSLPISYVPLAFDAMVSEGYADLRFKNNLNFPIYIKTWGDNEKIYVNIYGEPLPENLEIKRVSEFVKTIPHEGDMIIKDTKGEYSDKITYAGEYLRIKTPQEGYQAKGYICYYENDQLIEKKLIRNESYRPQKGIVMEGTAILGEGMILPENDVKIISPQIQSKINNLNKKMDEQNSVNYNP